ncbi:hypothetical protein GQ600_647 [Phytophthora cactorum]|nr:hypothetical protein GQ600_647 [Phytophthora cactorum]
MAAETTEPTVIATDDASELPEAEAVEPELWACPPMSISKPAASRTSWHWSWSFETSSARSRGVPWYVMRQSTDPMSPCTGSRHVDELQNVKNSESVKLSTSKTEEMLKVVPSAHVSK